MRNLKKFLALVLALMMAMSLMVTANASVTANVEYDDSYQVNEAFEEAVTVLAGMGVIKGYNGGETFQPKNNITRAEAATLVYRLATGDVNGDREYLYTDYALQSTLKDVTADKWYAGAVGYCANFGIVKGRSDGLFHANDPVTGYEILAMILRVVGYDKKGEFSGADWAYNVSTLATTLGVVDKVKTANYSQGGTSNLYAPATREVVASLLFETITRVPKVIYSDALSYINSGMTGGLLNGSTNPTVGYDIFGLRSNYGIVVGNAETGEDKSVTKIGFDVLPQNTSSSTNAARTNLRAIDDTLSHSRAAVNNKVQSAYVYESDTVGDSTYKGPLNVTLTFKWDSGLDLFGHKVKVWYSDLTSSVEAAGDARAYKFASNMETYAVFDNVGKSEVLFGVADLDVSKTANANELGKKGSFDATNGVYWNYAFGPTKAADHGTYPSANNANGGSWTADAEFASPIIAYDGRAVDGDGSSSTPDAKEYPLYLAISNHPDGKVDMIVSLELTITQIAQVNTVWTSVPTVGVYNANSSSDVAGDNISGSFWTRTGTDDYFDTYDNYTSGSNTTVYTEIAQKNLVGDSAKALNDKVVAIAVTGTTGTNSGKSTTQNVATSGNATAQTSTPKSLTSTYYYKLSKLTNVVPGTVYTVDQATGTVTLSDGSKMEKSPYSEVVDASFATAASVRAITYPQSNTTYTFTLDDEGRYIYWEPLASQTNFVYATYLDYGQPMSTSTFTYEITYTDSTGEQRQKTEVTSYDNKAFAATSNYNDNEMPKRDANAFSGTIEPGRYIGYVLSGKALREVTTKTGGNGGTADQPFIRGSSVDFNNTTSGGSGLTTITSTDAQVGAKQVADSALFLTENTVFHIVSGNGTDTQVVKNYKGLSELTKDMRSVVIDGRDITGNTSFKASLTGTASDSSLSYADMIYYSTEPFLYAQNYGYTYGTAEAVKEVFIPAEAVTFNKVTSSSLYFVGDSSSSIFNAYGENAVQFVMYKDGVKGNYWVEGKLSDGFNDSSAGAILNGTDNVFYGLEDTGKKTNFNETIYRIVPVAESIADASKIVIGKFYGDIPASMSVTSLVTSTDTTGIYGTNDITGTGDIATSGPAKYVPTTNALQAAFINVAVNPAAPGNYALYNVANAGVASANSVYTVTNVAELSAAGSLYDNVGVPVSCVLNANSTRIVDFIYVNK